MLCTLEVPRSWQLYVLSSCAVYWLSVDLQEQSELLWKIRDELKRSCPTSVLREMLEENNQNTTGGESVVSVTDKLFHFIVVSLEGGYWRFITANWASDRQLCCMRNWIEFHLFVHSLLTFKDKCIVPKYFFKTSLQLANKTRKGNFTFCTIIFNLKMVSSGTALMYFNCKSKGQNACFLRI